MFQRIKSNQPIVLFYIFLLSLLVWGHNLFIPEEFPASLQDNSLSLFQPLFKSLQQHVFVNVLLGLVLILAMGFILIGMNKKFILINERTYLPAFLFVLLSGSYILNQGIHPVLPASLLLTLALERIFAIYRKDYNLNRLFFAGVYLGLAAMFYIPFVFYFLLIWISLSILRPFVGREWFVPLLGFIAPLWFYFVYVFVFTEQLDEYISIIQNAFRFHFYIPETNYHYFGFYAFVLFLILMASLSIVRRFQMKKIRIRKYFEINWWLFVIGMVLFFLMKSTGYVMIIPISIPIAYLLTEYFYSIRKRWLGNVILFLLLGGLVYIQIVEFYL